MSHNDHDIHGPVIEVWPNQDVTLDESCGCPEGCAECSAGR